MAMDYYNNMGAIIGIVAIISIIAFAVTILQYVLRSLSLYTVAKRRGAPVPGLAWVPVIWVWTLGGICDQYDGTRGFTRKWRSVLLTLTIIVAACFLFGYILILAQVASMAAYSRFDFYSFSSVESVGALIGTFAGGYVLLILAAAVSVALSVCQTICIFKVFESCRPNDAVKYLLLSLLVPLALPICLMCCRNYDLGMPQQPQQPNYPPYPPQPPVRYDQAPPYNPYQ